jgi:NTP pyrophosphatase (non-canonical NTP hydrolase)
MMSRDRAIKQQQIIEEILKERKRQDEKFGEQNRNSLEWLAILIEEVGELSRSIVDKEILKFSFSRENRDLIHSYRDEMIQIAAVALNAIECFDRNK